MEILGQLRHHMKDLAKILSHLSGFVENELSLIAEIPKYFILFKYSFR